MAEPHRVGQAPQGQPAPIPSTVSNHLCIDFVNSMFMDHTGSGRMYDRLEFEEWRRWFAERCGFPSQASPAAGTCRDLVTMRRFLRRLLEAGTRPTAEAAAQLNWYLARSSQSWVLEPKGRSLELRLRWNGDGWPAVMAAVAASYARLVVSGDVRRVRVCANPDCSFMFCDDTRNASRRWCDTAICGNLMKVRRYRARV
jgi:predicted RNA-binding Zn ribbon-like protein